VQFAKEKYPGSRVVDYKHMGRSSETQSGIVRETFKLWMKDKSNDHQWGLWISYTFDASTEQVKNIVTWSTPN
jgi:hypothetical protein